MRDAKKSYFAWWVEGDAQLLGRRGGHKNRVTIIGGANQKYFLQPPSDQFSGIPTALLEKSTFAVKLTTNHYRTIYDGYKLLSNKTLDVQSKQINIKIQPYVKNQ